MFASSIIQNACAYIWKTGDDDEDDNELFLWYSRPTKGV